MVFKEIKCSHDFNTIDWIHSFRSILIKIIYKIKFYVITEIPSSLTIQKIKKIKPLSILMKYFTYPVAVIVRYRNMYFMQKKLYLKLGRFQFFLFTFLKLSVCRSSFFWN